MDTIRSTLILLESPAELEQIKLPYSRSALSPVMSSATLDTHYGKLYKGYVDRYNKGEGDKSFNEAGAYLHSIWFGQFPAYFHLCKLEIPLVLQLHHLCLSWGYNEFLSQLAHSAQL